jgi:hypothetical protein
MAGEGGVMQDAASVLALAPDEASVKAARGLVAPAKWPMLGADAAAVWGECQGSGSKPYQTQVDLSGPAFRCSCPSRKFPCKHGLALLLLRAGDPGRFQAARPAWVDEWLASREQKEKKKEEREERKAHAPLADPKSAAIREAQRWERIEGAVQELQRWMADQLAQGLGSVGGDSLEGWRTMAARMVDGQAPGLGQRLLQAAERVRQGADWPEQVIHRLGLLQLACDGVQRRTSLPEELQADLRDVVGWPMDRDGVVANGDAVDDAWSVLGVVQEQREAKLIERRVWLQGQHSQRRALLLEHAYGGRGFEQAWMSGSQVRATLHFFPGAAGLRALCGEPELLGTAHWPNGTLEQEWDLIARRVAASPWTSTHPLVLRDATLERMATGWRCVVQGRDLNIRTDETLGWQLLARSGGHPVHLAGEWDGEAFSPMSAWHDDQAAPLWIRTLA